MYPVDTEVLIVGAGPCGLMLANELGRRSIDTRVVDEENYGIDRGLGAGASFVDAMLVGLAQVGALIPGVSRSGSTLTAALALGFKRDEAARLSFLLGLPAIALAGLKELWELYRIHLDAQGWGVLGVGIVVASISAFFAIWGLMRILEQFSSWPFVVYRFVLGVIIVAGVATGWLG